jgi:hypothetical protein
MAERSKCSACTGSPACGRRQAWRSPYRILYGGALGAGLGWARAALLAGGAAVVLGGWFTASAVLAAHGGYHAQLGHQVPWLPIVVAGFLGLLPVLRRIPAVARALTAPGMTSRLELPHSFRVFGERPSSS